MARKIDDDIAQAAALAAMGMKKIPRRAPVKKGVPRKAAAKKIPAKRARRPPVDVAAVAAAVPVEHVKAEPIPPKKAPRRRAPRKAVAPPPEELVPVLEPDAEPQVDLAELIPVDEEGQGFRAYQLSLQGYSLREIGERLDLTISAAHAAVHLGAQTLNQFESIETALERRRIAIAVTEVVKAANWDKMLTGDKDATTAVLKANADYFRMAGLEKADIKIKNNNTIVVRGGDEMAGDLRAVAEAADEARRRAQTEEIITDVGDDA